MKKLFLYTATYPFGQGETFIDHDLSVLVENYDKIFLIPFSKTGKQRTVPFDNVEVLDLPEHENVSVSLIKALKANKKFLKGLAHIRENRAYLKNVLKYRKAVLNILESNPGAVHFSFWMNEWAILLSQLKKDISFSFVCRGHGYDVFSERNEKGYIPFQHLIVNCADKIILSSEFSRDYLTDKYPSIAEKFETVHLNPAVSLELNDCPKNEFHFVSVSNLVEVKQVHLIPEFLSKLQTDKKIKWTHIGAGKTKNKVLEELKKLDVNIEYCFLGHLDNKEIIEFYKESKITAFLHCSASEGGVPLAIKEAFSFGLPLIALPNGGVREVMKVHPYSYNFNEEIDLSIIQNIDRKEVKQAYKSCFSRFESQHKLLDVISSIN